MFKPDRSAVFGLLAVVATGACLAAGVAAQEDTLPALNTAAGFEQPPYPKIKVVELVAGHERFTDGMPQYWKNYARFIPQIPRQIETDIYRYEGVTGPTKQNVSIGLYPVDCGDGRCIAAHNV